MSETPKDWENELMVVSGERVRQAITLAEQVLQDSPDDVSNWPGENAHNSLTRHVTEAGGDTLLGSKFTGHPDGEKVIVMRYLLELETGAFVIIPGLYDNVESIGADDDPEHNEDIVAMTFDLGHHLANDDDWNDFIKLMEDGKSFSETLRSLEAKLRVKLGSAATIDWDDWR